MQRFCKVFETDVSQVLFMTRQGDDGPEFVQIMTMPSGISVETALSFSDNNVGWGAVGALLDSASQSVADGYVEASLRGFPGLRADAREAG